MFGGSKRHFEEHLQFDKSEADWAGLPVLRCRWEVLLSSVPRTILQTTMISGHNPGLPADHTFPLIYSASSQTNTCTQILRTTPHNGHINKRHIHCFQKNICRITRYDRRLGYYSVWRAAAPRSTPHLAHSSSATDALDVSHRCGRTVASARQIRTHSPTHVSCSINTKKILFTMNGYLPTHVQKCSVQRYVQQVHPHSENTKRNNVNERSSRSDGIPPRGKPEANVIFGSLLCTEY